MKNLKDVNTEIERALEAFESEGDDYYGSPGLVLWVLDALIHLGESYFHLWNEVDCDSSGRWEIEVADLEKFKQLCRRAKELK